MPGPELSDNKNTNPKSGRKKSRALVVGVIIILSAVCIGVALAVSLPHMLDGGSDKKAEKNEENSVNLDDNEYICENVYINDINVGGLTKEGALKKLESEVLPSELKKEIALTYEDERFTYTFADFGMEYDFKASVDAAYSVGRQGPKTQKSKDIENVLANKLELEAAFDYSKEKIDAVLEEIASGIDREAVNATMERVNGEFSITAEEKGLVVNRTKLVSDIIAVLEKGERASITIEVEEELPEFTEQAFKDATQLIGTFYTVVAGSEANRNKNLDTAASKLNEYVVYPDEVFSTNATFGEMTTENGYRMAPVIVGGELTNGMGGGVCQVSSTLYMALLYAEVEIVERQNHSQKVGYADYGFDATLAGDYIDLKFRNDTGYPLTIESYIEGNKVYVNLYGYELHSPSRRLEFYNVFTGSVGAPAEKIVEDPSLPLGERYVKTSARNGANYDLYKIVYDGNTEISREQVNTSKYRARAAVVHVGTGEAVEGETPAEVEPTETTGEGASPEEVTPPAVSEQPQVEQPVTEPPVSETPAVPSETPSGQQEVYTPVVPQQTPQPMVTPNPSGSGEKPVEPAPVIVDPVIEVPSVDTPPIVD